MSQQLSFAGIDRVVIHAGQTGNEVDIRSTALELVLNFASTVPHCVC